MSGNSRRQGEWPGKRLGRAGHGKRRAQIKQGLEIPDADILLEA